MLLGQKPLITIWNTHDSWKNSLKKMIIISGPRFCPRVLYADVCPANVIYRRLPLEVVVDSQSPTQWSIQQQRYHICRRWWSASSQAPDFPSFLFGSEELRHLNHGQKSSLHQGVANHSERGIPLSCWHSDQKEEAGRAGKFFIGFSCDGNLIFFVQWQESRIRWF